MAPVGAVSLRRWRPAQLQALTDALQAIGRAWHRDWCAPRSPQLRLRIEPMAEGASAPPVAWQALNAATDDEGAAWLATLPATRDAVPEALAGLLFDAAPSQLTLAPMARSVADSAWNDLLQRLSLAKAPRPGDFAAARPHTGYWSGALRLTVGVNAFECALLVDVRWVERMLARIAVSPSPPAVKVVPTRSPLQPALSFQCARLGVDLGEVELDLGRLLALQVGDVVRLPQRLDEPLRLSLGSHLLARVHLGRRGPRRAVEMAPANPASASAAPHGVVAARAP